MAAYAERACRTAAAAMALLAACAAGRVEGRAVDTVLVCDGGVGPYVLTDGFLDTAGCTVAPADSMSGPLPAHELLPDSGALRFVAPPGSGTRVRVRFHTDYVGLPRTLRLQVPGVPDTTALPGDHGAPERSAGPATPDASESVRVSGYKSVGLSLGNLGQTSLEQALEITLAGHLPRGTEIRGHISDQGTSLDGGTREIAELDRVYLTLKHPRFEVTVGDQYATWPAGGLIAENRKIKGLSAAVTTRPVDVRAFGSISSGRYAIGTIRGREGLQGPYFLSGNGEADIITPVSGTVRVLLDGDELREGPEADYAVDYDYGSITFSPSRPITDDRTIRVEYEYKTFDYQRTLVGGDLRVTIRDSLLVLRGALWNEQDNRHEPIDLDLAAEDEALLAQAGDSSLERLVRVPVDARDVEEYAARYPLYALRDSGGASFFEYVPYDPSMPPEQRQSLYWVRFRTVAAGAGDYLQDTIDYRGPIYRYVGPGVGTATAGNPLPLPARTTLGEARLSTRPVRWLEAAVDVAGMSRDRNLFSDRDDGDNNGAATMASVRVGQDTSAGRGVWLAAYHRLITRDYTREVLSAYELDESWHTQGFGTGRTTRQVWEAAGGGSVGPLLSARAAYGQIRTDDRRLTDRLRAAGQSTPLPWLTLSYQGRYLRHSADSLDRSRRQDIGAAFRFRQAGVRLEAWDEWRHSDSFGRGDAAGRAGFTLRDSVFSERFTYTLHGRGIGPLYTIHDTSRTLLWEQSLKLTPSALWRISASSAYRRRTYETAGPMTTVLVRALADYYSPSRGLGTRLDYDLTSERAAALVQIPSYVGEGLGGFAYDSARGELVPDARGAFAYQEREVLDNSTDALVRKSRLGFTWSLRPRRSVHGILGDLGWRGEMQLLEHVLPDSTADPLAWVPGVMTIGDRDRRAVPLANCWYEQRISWEPDSALSGYRGELLVRPYVMQSQRGREAGVRGSLGGERSSGRWTTAAALEALRYVHDGPEEFDVTDIGAELSQKYRLVGELRAVVTERGGWARRLEAGGWYGAVRPGLTWQGADRGWAELTYSFAYVNIPGTLDYAMAAGFRGGITHRIDCHASVAIGDHFRLGAAYRGLFEKPLEKDDFLPSTHVVSMEVKAML